MKIFGGDIMFLNKQEIEYVKVSEIARKNSLHPRRVYEWIRLLENSGKISFDKTPLGGRLIRKDQVDVILEFGMLEDVFDDPSDIMHIIFNSSEFKTPSDEGVEGEHFWTKGLKNIVWRRF